MNDINTDNFISLSDAAKILGVTSYTLRNLLFEEDIIDGHSIGGKLFFKKSEFEKAKEELKKKLNAVKS